MLYSGPGGDLLLGLADGERGCELTEMCFPPGCGPQSRDSLESGVCLYDCESTLPHEGKAHDSEKPASVTSKAQQHKMLAQSAFPRNAGRCRPVVTSWCGAESD